MKTYSLPTPDTLRKAARGVKWEKHRRALRSFADEWQRTNCAETVVLEIGRNAHIFRTTYGKKTLIAAMYITAARNFVKELDEV